MPFQPDPNTITWRLHLRSAPAAVYELLATDAGRARFWAESAVERDGAIDFVFPAGQRWRGAILERRPPQRFAVVYYGSSTTTFVLEDDGAGGTELTLTDAGVPEADRAEVVAGWASVLMGAEGRGRLRRRPAQPRCAADVGAGVCRELEQSSVASCQQC